MEHTEVIEKIAPLYNRFKQNKTNISPVALLEIMWDTGNILKEYITKKRIQPHKLFREIYGKSENTKNISKQSYITREFQSRAYRIRNIFDSKHQISLKLGNLKSFTFFREAMPFFDNPKYLLVDNEMDSLLLLLNSNLSQSEIFKAIKKLQREKIGINNPRTQKLAELDSVVNIFKEFYKSVANVFIENNYNFLKTNNIGPDLILFLARNTSALMQENLKFFPTNSNFEIMDNAWINYYCFISKIIKPIDEKIRRRLRRLIPPEKIGYLSDMLFALQSNEKFEDFKRNYFVNKKI